MCGVKVKDKIPNKEFREILGLNDIILVPYYSKIVCDGMGICCEKIQ